MCTLDKLLCLPLSVLNGWTDYDRVIPRSMLFMIILWYKNLVACVSVCVDACVITRVVKFSLKVKKRCKFHPNRSSEFFFGFRFYFFKILWLSSKSYYCMYDIKNVLLYLKFCRQFLYQN